MRAPFPPPAERLPRPVDRRWEGRGGGSSSPGRAAANQRQGLRPASSPGGSATAALRFSREGGGQGCPTDPTREPRAGDAASQLGCSALANPTEPAVGRGRKLPSTGFPSWRRRLAAPGPARVGERTAASRGQILPRDPPAEASAGSSHPPAPPEGARRDSKAQVLRSNGGAEIPGRVLRSELARGAAAWALRRPGRTLLGRPPSKGASGSPARTLEVPACSSRILAGGVWAGRHKSCLPRTAARRRPRRPTLQGCSAIQYNPPRYEHKPAQFREQAPPFKLSLRGASRPHVAEMCLNWS